MIKESPLARLGAVQSSAGAVLLLRPRGVARAISGGPDAAPPAWLVRILGLRLLGQGAALIRWPTRRAERISTTIDAAHGLSMLAVAVASPAHRRPALTAAGAAALSVIASARLAAPTPSSSPRR